MAACVILCAGVAIALLTRRRRVEPSFEGKPLSHWLIPIDGIATHVDRSSPEFLQASNAVIGMGTNSLPLLLDWIQYRPSLSYRMIGEPLSKALERIPGEWIPLGLRRPYDVSWGDYRASCAGYALRILGTNVTPIIPELASLAGSDAPRQISWYAVRALEAAGPAAWGDLLQLVMDPGRPASRDAIEGLASMGTNATPAIPALLGHLRDPRSASSAAKTLGKLQLKPDVVVPVLKQTLQSSNSHLRADVARALGDFGVAAMPALGDLRIACADRDSYVRLCASNAVQRIAPGEVSP